MVEFCKASGLSINLPKSKMFFSKEVPRDKQTRSPISLLSDTKTGRESILNTKWSTLGVLASMVPYVHIHDSQLKYVVRKSYNWLITPHDRTNINTWGWIWKLKTLYKKVKHFYWLKFHDAFPTHHLRRLHHISQDRTCSCCLNIYEFILLALRDCSHAHQNTHSSMLETITSRIHHRYCGVIIRTLDGAWIRCLLDCKEAIRVVGRPRANLSSI
ncbi:hypothetical protein VNO77_33783 [Canavalia gladiata]|uniref:Reverse transcriptase zinc-binding domain-containing protein n=1 Tax=Canavalia gladiata TaxID=3824 RepID=A0AAN9PY08_CANGL